MAILDQVNNNRVNMNTSLNAYKAAVIAGGDVTAEKTEAITRINNYIDSVTTTKRNNASLEEDQFYSNPVLMTQALRDFIDALLENGPG